METLQIFVSVGGSLLAALVTVGTLSRKMVTKEDIAEMKKDIADIKTDNSARAQVVAVHEWRIDSLEKHVFSGGNKDVQA